MMPAARDPSLPDIRPSHRSGPMALTHLVERYCELPIRLRKPLWRFLHYLVGKLDGDGSTLFLNYGFAEGNGAAPPLALAPEE